MSATLEAEPLTLPNPVDRPEADVVLFDGHCRFCRAAVTRLDRLDSRGQLAYLSLHDPVVSERWPQLSHEQLMADMHLVSRAGDVYRGVDAYRYMSTRMPRLWWLAPLLHFPFSMPLWRMLYRQVAKRRYLIFGKTQTCEHGVCQIPKRK